MYHKDGDGSTTRPFTIQNTIKERVKRVIRKINSALAESDLGINGLKDTMDMLDEDGRRTGGALVP
jgi:hypothetical protein